MSEQSEKIERWLAERADVLGALLPDGRVLEPGTGWHFVVEETEHGPVLHPTWTDALPPTPDSPTDTPG